VLGSVAISFDRHAMAMLVREDGDEAKLIVCSAGTKPYLLDELEYEDEEDGQDAGKGNSEVRSSSVSPAIFRIASFHGDIKLIPVHAGLIVAACLVLAAAEGLHKPADQPSLGVWVGCFALLSFK